MPWPLPSAMAVSLECEHRRCPLPFPFPLVSARSSIVPCLPCKAPEPPMPHAVPEPATPLALGAPSPWPSPRTPLHMSASTTRSGWTPPVMVPRGFPVPACPCLHRHGAPLHSTALARGAPDPPGAIGPNLASHRAVLPRLCGPWQGVHGPHPHVSRSAAAPRPVLRHRRAFPNRKLAAGRIPLSVLYLCGLREGPCGKININ